MPASFDRNLGFLLHDAARLLRKRFDQRARSLGLTRAQWSVLAHLSRQEGINQATLADILEIEPITLVRLLDRLEAAGWLERRPDPRDRRARLLFLTEAAHPMLDRMRALGAETREEAVAGLSEEDRERLIDTLVVIKKNLSETGGEASSTEFRRKAANA
jgi:DNA-binding MarR family transcriptional regulator